MKKLPTQIEVWKRAAEVFKMERPSKKQVLKALDKKKTILELATELGYAYQTVEIKPEFQQLIWEMLAANEICADGEWHLSRKTTLKKVKKSC